jgi:hypothetical protein
MKNTLETHAFVIGMSVLIAVCIWALWYMWDISEPEKKDKHDRF